MPITQGIREAIVAIAKEKLKLLGGVFPSNCLNKIMGQQTRGRAIAKNQSIE